MATLQSGKCFTVPTFFGMCCKSEWQERMYIYKWHEVDQTKHEIFCVHIVCNEIQVKVNFEITTFFFYLRFPYCPNFFWFGVVHVNHVQPVCTFLSRTVMLILIFNSTAYCHAHSFILYILYFVLYILFFIHFILCILPLCCILQYNICTVHGADLTHISLLVIHSLYSRVCDK